MTANFVDGLRIQIEPHAQVAVLTVCAALTHWTFQHLCKSMHVFDARALAIALSVLIVIGAARILGDEAASSIATLWLRANAATHSLSLPRHGGTQLDGHAAQLRLVAVGGRNCLSDRVKTSAVLPCTKRSHAYRNRSSVRHARQSRSTR